MFMENKNKRFIFIVLLFVAAMGNNLFGCITTFINDSNNRIAILNELDQTFIVIQKNGKRRFGNHAKHAHFTVYTIQKEKSQLWGPAYSCKQNECGPRGNVILKLSDIENCNDATKLFTIKKYQPYTSMVNKLPMIQKKSCHCNCR
jgi:hypothetical protein